MQKESTHGRVCDHKLVSYVIIIKGKTFDQEQKNFLKNFVKKRK